MKPEDITQYMDVVSLQIEAALSLMDKVDPHGTETRIAMVYSRLCNVRSQVRGVADHYERVAREAADAAKATQEAHA